MNPRELVSAALRGDDLATRRVVKDAKRHAYSWSQAPAPDFADKTDRAVYRRIVELLAERNGEAARRGPATSPRLPSRCFSWAERRR